MSIFNMNRVYSPEVWPDGKFSKIIEYNDELEALYEGYNVFGDQQYWSTIAQNPEYNRPSTTN